MEEEEVLKLEKKSLTLESRSLKHPGQRNYDVFRKHVSTPFLQLFGMSKPVSCRHKWMNGVNLAMSMQAMFKPKSLAKLQSPSHSQLLKKHDGGSRKLAGVIDYIANQAFASFPKDLQELSYISFRANPSLAEKFMNPQRVLTQPSPCGSEIVRLGLGPCLKYYCIICEEKDLKDFFLPTFLIMYGMRNSLEAASSASAQNSL